MGQHRRNPNAIAAATGHDRMKAAFNFDIKLDADVKVTLQPKKNLVVMPDNAMLIEADGSQFVGLDGVVAKEPVPEGAIVAKTGDAMKDEWLDLVVSLRVLYTKGTGGVVVSHLPQIQMPVAELARIPWVDIQAKVADILAKMDPPAPLVSG